MKLWCAYSTGDEAWEFYFTRRQDAVDRLQGMLKQQHHRTDTVILNESDRPDSSPDFRFFWVCSPFITYQLDSVCFNGDCGESDNLLPFSIEIKYPWGAIGEIAVNQPYEYAYTDFMVYPNGCPEGVE